MSNVYEKQLYSIAAHYGIDTGSENPDHPVHFMIREILESPCDRDSITYILKRYGVDNSPSNREFVVDVCNVFKQIQHKPHVVARGPTQTKGNFYSVLLKIVCGALRGDPEFLSHVLEISENHVHKQKIAKQNYRKLPQLHSLKGSYTVSELLDIIGHDNISSQPKQGLFVNGILSGMITKQCKLNLKPHISDLHRERKKANNYALFMKQVGIIIETHDLESSVSTVAYPRYSKGSSSGSLYESLSVHLSCYLGQKNVSVFQICHCIKESCGFKPQLTQITGVLWGLIEK
jgi:hypothetical protein